MEDFEGKVVIVTGAGSGIGRASAVAFARAGARVVVSDSNPDSGEATTLMIRGINRDAMFVRADVSQEADVAHLVEQTIARYGRLDCAHNNAGISGSGLVTALAEVDFDRVIAVNLKGVWLCMKHQIPPMLAAGRGAIVNTASVLGLVGIAGSAAYVASKHGVAGLTKVAALENSRHGVRINAICPGVIDTPFMADGLSRPGVADALLAVHPIGRLGTADEIAAATLWLASDAASFVTGAMIPVDGGWTTH